MKHNYSIVKTVALALSMLMIIKSHAQLKGDHLLGDFGLNAGTQAPPTIIVAVPFYWYTASEFAKGNGDKIDAPKLNVFFTGVGASVVTNLKILHANYGFSVLAAFMTNRVEGEQVHSSTSLGFSDMYVQPLQLGWHMKQVDVTAGYGLYIPTGKYEAGGDGNTGLGMWTNEFSAGTTLFFNPKKTFSFSSIAFFETHSKKKDVETKVGNIISVEGGLTKTFYKPISGFPIPVVFNAGVIYYMQFKVSDDQIPVGNTVFTGSRDNIYAYGLEFNVLHPKIRTSLGFRWLGETGARNRFQGNAFFITLGYIAKSLAKKKE
jgi:hypothetical protein